MPMDFCLLSAMLKFCHNLSNIIIYVEILPIYISYLLRNIAIYVEILSIYKM